MTSLERISKDHLGFFFWVELVLKSPEAPPSDLTDQLKGPGVYLLKLAERKVDPTTQSLASSVIKVYRESG